MSVNDLLDTKKLSSSLEMSGEPDSLNLKNEIRETSVWLKSHFNHV